MTATRHFLGWDRTPLDLAADWLAERAGPDLGRHVVALPGARAGRLLLERLVERCGPSWVPPRFVTAGKLTDVLLTLPAPPAGRLARTLAWELALRGLAPGELERVAAAPPAADDLLGWMRLAGEVRALFGEVAAEGLAFHDVERGPARRASGAGEQARWAALARAQEHMLRHLAEQGLSDPHTARREALEAGRIDRAARVVLVGVVELNGLTRRLLSALDPECLVLAPDELAERFDELGCVRAESWAEHHTALPLESWHVVEQPVQQAERALECVAGWGASRFRAEQITVGVARESVAPYLRRHLAAHGLVARDAAGTPVMETPPARLLAALAAHLRRPVFETFAALLRHDRVEYVLRKDEALRAVNPARTCDAYQAAHVPYRLDGTWPVDEEDEHDVKRQQQVARLHGALQDLLGALAAPGSRPLSGWISPLRRFLEKVYGTSKLERDGDEEQRCLIEGLSALGEALAELEHEVPDGLAPRAASAAEAVELLLLELRSRAVPPRPARPGETTVELLGWLELPLDDAPGLVVTGFDEGCVPQAVQGDPWLPDSVRRELGMADSRGRLARDLYAVDLMVHSREEVAFVSGRRTVEGDPVLPSRIAFHRPEDEVPARVRRALPRGQRAALGGGADVGGAAPPFVAGLGAEPERWSPTALRDFLESPYTFWLKRIANKRTVDDRERELDPLRFGSLAHAVLEDFGRSDLRHSADADAIAAFLRERLWAQAERRFGSGTYPAVELQLHQLDHRLGHFAARQVQRLTAGWRIEQVEWEPAAGVALDVPGGAPAVLTGKIDRIDRHADGRWAILDYKTSERGGKPDQVHRKAGQWRDVQLPVYAWLARELIGEARPALGYVTLGRKTEKIGFQIAPWGPEEVDQALDVARGVIARVRALLASGEPFEHSGRPPYEPILKAITGERLIGVGGGEE